MVDKKTLLTNILNFLCKYNNNAEDAYCKKLLLNLSRKYLLLLTYYLLIYCEIIELLNYQIIFFVIFIIIFVNIVITIIVIIIIDLRNSLLAATRPAFIL